MTVGGEVSWVLGLHELSRAAATAGGCEVYLRGVETAERVAALGREARRTADAFRDLAELADQRELALEAEADELAARRRREERG